MDSQDQLPEQVIGLAMKVHRKHGPGFVEFVYRNSLLIELKKANLLAETEKRTKVYYDGIVVGDFDIDLFVGGWLICELKAVRNLTEEHEIQLVNYLTAIQADFGLLINFGAKSLQFKRKYRRSNPTEEPPDLQA